ncbi:rotatin-like [Stigmatopora argus]
MELSGMIKKMGHSLSEIRVRALKSIICKLKHSLISIPDIVQEKMLFVYLLEWFKFPEVPMQEEVLDLLLILSKHPSAAQMLRDVDAEDILLQLSTSVQPSLRPIIDETLDQLFQLPELIPCPTSLYMRKPHITHQTDLPSDEQFPSRGYFQKSMPNHVDVPPLKIAGTDFYIL